jgi:hypothetical protein
LSWQRWISYASLTYKEEGGEKKGKIGKIQERTTPKYDARNKSDLMPMYLPGSQQFLLFLGQMRTVKQHHDGEQLESETEYEY